MRISALTISKRRGKMTIYYLIRRLAVISILSRWVIVFDVALSGMQRTRCLTRSRNVVLISDYTGVASASRFCEI